LKKNITPVVFDNLVNTSEVTCLPPAVVTRQAGCPVTKRIRVDRCRFSKPEDSTIVCNLCGKIGHNRRTYLARQTFTTNEKMSNDNESPNDYLQLPPADVL
jgi:hypothetical protein